MSLCTEIPGSPNAIHPLFQSIPRKASTTQSFFFVSLKFDTILIGKMQHDGKNKKVIFFLFSLKAKT